VNDTIIKLVIIDHPGEEKSRSITLNFCRNSSLIVFVYKDYDSFHDVKKLINETKEICIKNIHYALINSLSEQENDSQISRKEVEKFIKKEGIDLFMEVSHYTGYNINNLFFEIAKILYMNKE